MGLQPFEHVSSSVDGERRRRGLEVGAGGREGGREHQVGHEASYLIQQNQLHHENTYRAFSRHHCTSST